MAEKLIPHTANALTVGLTDKAGDSEYLGMSQKGVNDLISGGSSSETGGETSTSTGIEEAPKDGKFYARKNGAWVEISSVSAVDPELP